MAEDAKQFTILVADDEVGIALAINEALKREGYNVLLAADGEQALAMALNHRPNLILTDLRMPLMTGTDMVQKIRNHDDWGKKVDIIFLTNLIDEKILEATTNVEHTSYLLKGDLDLVTVISRVNAILNTNILTPAPEDAGIAEARNRESDSQIEYSS